ncbi:MAG: lysylphosphatidylglycerol synthase domain-containing protein [Bacteroidota bacterium]
MRLISYTAAIGANVHKNFLPVLRVVIALTALVYTGLLIVQIPGHRLQQWQDALALTPSFYWLILAVVMLMGLNWTLESAKWKLLSAKIQPLCWQQSFLSILYGISLGMITPKRTGEFAGRLLFLQPRHRIGGILLNSAGSLSQLFITLLAGTIAILMQLPLLTAENRYAVSPLGNLSPGWLHLAWSFAVVAGLLVFAIPHLKRSKFLSPSNLRNRFSSWLAPLGRLNLSDITIILALSLGRYMVFTTQFYLLLQIFGLQISFSIAFQLIAITWLVMTLIPLSAIWELGVRGPIAALVFGTWFAHTNQPFGEVAVMAASTTLWLINLALPAIAGGLLSITAECKTTIIRND